jgi:hypothetical protein
MSFFNSYICPRCNAQFPAFIRPSIRINRGLLAPFLTCPHCGQVCRQGIDPLRAIWLWPLTLCFFISAIYVFQGLYREATVLYITLIIASLFPVIIGIRRGMKLIKVEDCTIKRSRSMKWFLPLVVIAMFSLLWRYYFDDCLNIIIGILVGLIVWAFFYYFSKKKGLARRI